MVDGVPDQGVGGVDAMTQLSTLFEQQNVKQGEIFQQHLNVLTAMAQKIQMGGAGPVDFQANTALAGITTAASMATQRAMASPDARGAVSLGGPPPGQVTGATMAAQGAAGPAGSLAAPVRGNPLAGQVGAPQISGGGSTGGPPPGSSPGGGQGSGGGGGGGGGGGAGIPGYAPAVGAQSGGLANTLWSKTAKIPVVGSIINKVPQFFGEWQNQRNKNLWYRAYTGDTSAGQEFADRIAEEKSRLQHPSVFSEGESREAFKQISAMGYGQNAEGSRYSRTDMMNMMATAKKETGLGVSQLSQNYDMMGRNGDTGISSLTEQIKNLQTEAGKAGDNVQQAVQSLTMMSQANYKIFGSSGRNIASSDATIQAAWGKNFQDVDMQSRYQNPGYMYAMAGQNGMSESALVSLATTNKSQFDVKTGTVTKEKVAQWLQSADPGAYRALMDEIQRSKADLAGPAAGDRAQQIAEDWWQTHASRAIDPQAFVSLVNLWAGQKFSAMDRVGALKYFIINYYSALGSLALGQKGMNASGTIDASGKVASGKNAGMQAGQTTSGLFKTLGGSSLTSAEAAFKSEVDTQHGRYSGAMANTMKYFQSHGGTDDQMVRVETKSGYRVMKTSEAIKGGYESQITSGRAQMVGGTLAGKTIADLGINADTSKRNMRKARASERRATSSGQAYSDYYKAHPDAMTGAKKGNPNKVTFGLTKEAAMLLRPIKSNVEDAMGVPRRDIVTPMRDFFSHPSGGSALSLAKGVASVPGHLEADAADAAVGTVEASAGVVGDAWDWATG